MMYALNDHLASFVFIDCFIVLKLMAKCVLLLQIKIYNYIYCWGREVSTQFAQQFVTACRLCRWSRQITIITTRPPL